MVDPSFSIHRSIYQKYPEFSIIGANYKMIENQTRNVIFNNAATFLHNQTANKNVHISLFRKPLFIPPLGKNFLWSLFLVIWLYSKASHLKLDPSIWRILFSKNLLFIFCLIIGSWVILTLRRGPSIWITIIRYRFCFQL